MFNLIRNPTKLFSIRHTFLSTSKLFLRKLFRKNPMEEDIEVTISASYNILNSFLEKHTDKDEGFKKYLKQLKYPPIKDFSKGLEWFNVSESLSLTKQLQGKVVVLDFFTYCCINCMHILPDLKEIEEEFTVEDGLVVIGVHSAKFENEKNSKNILAAVQRYSISHPVVNDYNADMWRNCDVHCWPTLLLIGPNGTPIVMLMGEGHKEDLQFYIKNALEYFKSEKQISNHSLPIKSSYHLLPDLKGPLLFPGKITCFTDKNSNTELLAISDTGNNRILIINKDGMILKQIGGSRVGFKDGNFQEALFNNPQGLIFKNKDILFVADTENHAVRKVDLKNNFVETVVGTGEQGHDRVGGNNGKMQSISSPWDLCIYRTKDLDKLSVESAPIKEVLIIAMAGTHQIWALFLDDIVWWKSKKYSANTCACIAGSGREENRNNQYPHAAAFAQPSGLALCQKNKEVYIADSESSSVRRLSLIDGKVTAVVGGNNNPQNLFAFGDKDGRLYDAKLQHLLGLAISNDETTLFVADTYNHKLKCVDILHNEIKTLTAPVLDTTDGKSTIFNEPAGLCVGTDKKIYLADTNNHCIKVLHVTDDNQIVSLQNLNLLDKSIRQEKSSLKVIESKTVVIIDNKGGKIIFNLDVCCQNSLKITTDAPQKWMVNLPNATWSCVPNSGCNTDGINVFISVPPNMNQNSDLYIDFTFHLVTCTDEKCLPKSFILRQHVLYKEGGVTAYDGTIKVLLSPDEIKVS